MKKSLWVLSFSYWFSSRTLGLLVHPYITVRVILREHFLRPLILVPVFFWILSWILGMFLTRVGMFLNLGSIPFAFEVSMAFLFVWVWGTIFVMLWQIVLMYLSFRFLNTSKA